MSGAAATSPGGAAPFRLIEGCLRCIGQCGELLDRLPPEAYARPGADGASSIGAHVRHLLDRFHCFFAGLDGACVDYDERRRDPAVETAPDAARSALAAAARRLERLDLAAVGRKPMAVRETAHPLGPRVEVSSTVGRELMGLVTHSTHHLAIMSAIARRHGFAVDRDIGKAPSTLIHERN